MFGYKLEKKHQVINKSKLPLHVQYAIAEIGVAEIKGESENNKRILNYWKYTDLVVDTDEIAWCASFVNRCLALSGMNYTGAPNARSYLKWGVHVPHNKVKIGDVAIWKYGDWQGHVAIVSKISKDRKGYICTVGGNQQDRVSEIQHPIDEVAEFRREKTAKNSTTVATGTIIAGTVVVPHILDVLGINVEVLESIVLLLPDDIGHILQSAVTLAGAIYIVVRKYKKLPEDKA